MNATIVCEKSNLIEPEKCYFYPRENAGKLWSVDTVKKDTDVHFCENNRLVLYKGNLVKNIFEILFSYY